MKQILPPRGIRAVLLAAAAALLAAAALPAAAAEEPGGPGSGQDSDLVVYPSYRPVWDAKTETFSLKSTVYILNTGAEELRDLVFLQEAPERVGINLISLTESEKKSRPEGFEETIEGNSYRMKLPVLRPQEGALLQNHLTLTRRLGHAGFPGILVEFKRGEERSEVRLPEQTYDLTVYSDHVGSLERFLKKRCKISLDLTSGGRDVWEFAGQDAAASGSNPTGILGVELKDEKRGYYRLRSGAPGDLVEVMVVWNPVRKRPPDQIDTKALVKTLEDYLKWVGNYRFDRSTLKLTRKTFGGYEDSYILEGRWVDQVANRLGEGPFRWIKMYSPRVRVEYFLLLMAQARGLGAEESKTPQPEREAALMKELDGYARTFDSSIIPLSHK